MLSAIQSHLVKRMLVVQEIRYKNLLPLYADESIRICARPMRNSELWLVWIENESGSRAVDASVKTSSML